MGAVDKGPGETSQDQIENLAAGSTHSAAAGEADSSADLPAVTFEVAHAPESAEAAFAGGDQHIADDVLAAVASMTPDTLTSIEHALDQLTSATDLFDVSPLDFDPGTGS
jgi:hypothetical protein